MRAYHNDPAIKTAILAQLQAHHDADDIVKGVYWQAGKGCAIGCAIHGSDHALYEQRFGIPEMLARLEDRIFEGLPNAESKLWPLRFMGAIAPGASSRTSSIASFWPKAVQTAARMAGLHEVGRRAPAMAPSPTIQRRPPERKKILT